MVQVDSNKYDTKRCPGNRTGITQPLQGNS